MFTSQTLSPKNANDTAFHLALTVLLGSSGEGGSKPAAPDIKKYCQQCLPMLTVQALLTETGLHWPWPLPVAESFETPKPTPAVSLLARQICLGHRRRAQRTTVGNTITGHRVVAGTFSISTYQRLLELDRLFDQLSPVSL